MPRAIWKGTVVAAADRVERVKGNACFPPEALRRTHVHPGDPPPAVTSIRNMVTFRHGVEVAP